MVMHTCNPIYSGGWGRTIAWTREVEVAVSWDGATALQPGQETLYKKRKREPMGTKRGTTDNGASLRKKGRRRERLRKNNYQVLFLTPGWWNTLYTKPPRHEFAYINKPVHAPLNLKYKFKKDKKCCNHYCKGKINEVKNDPKNEEKYLQTIHLTKD